MEGVKLVRLDAAYADEVAAYRRAFLEIGSAMDGTSDLGRFDDPAAWMIRCAQLEDRLSVPEGWAPATQLLYVREADGKVVGMLNLRHTLNDSLMECGGHIGYSVRPDERRKGYAASMLHDALGLAQEMGMERVLVTCDEGNEGSRRTILKNGGVYDSAVFVQREGARVQRYWIAL